MKRTALSIAGKNFLPYFLTTELHNTDSLIYILHYKFTIKNILTAFLPEDWKTPPRRPRIKWIKTVLNDLESHNLTLTEAVNMAQNCPF